MNPYRQVSEAGSSAQSHVVVSGEVFSTNLGDQIIARCLQAALGSTLPHSSIRLLDLFARKEPETTVAISSQSRVSFSSRMARRVRRANPVVRRLFNLMSWYLWQRRRTVRTYQQALQGAKLLIVGGGQLLADNDLAFPLRLAALTRCARSLQVPVVVFACGAGTSWSHLGKTLLRRALNRTKGIWIRDRKSQQFVRDLGINSALPVAVAPDPAVMAASVFKVESNRLRRGVIGLGVMTPEVLARYAPGGARITEPQLMSFWVELMRQLHARRRSFELFTNGSYEDLKFAGKVADAAERALSQRVTLFCPATADAFVHHVSIYGAVVAHRLHACILSVATDVPVLGLAWDDKVLSFFVEAGIENCVIPLNAQRPETVVERLESLPRPSSVTDLESEMTRALKGALSFVRADDRYATRV